MKYERGKKMKTKQEVKSSILVKLWELQNYPNMIEDNKWLYDNLCATLEELCWVLGDDMDELEDYWEQLNEFICI